MILENLLVSGLLDGKERKMNNERKTLILGGAGGLAYLLSKLLLEKHPQMKILAVDSRESSLHIYNERYQFKKIKYSKGNFENLFRDEQFDTVIHLARMSHTLKGYQEVYKRLELNVIGTSTILDLCQKYGTKKVIVLSTFHVYGALPDNPVFIKENAALKASIKYPELRDVVDMDQVATNWMWQNKDQTETVVLRPCNIIGPLVNNTMSRYLSGKLAIIPVDYKPMFQFIHEFDMAKIIALALTDFKTGIYNVSPDDYMDLKKAMETLNIKSLPFPMFIGHVVNKALKSFGQNVPAYFIEYLKYSCLISNQKLKETIPEHQFRFSTKQALELIKAS